MGGPFIAGSVRRYTTQHDKPRRPGLVYIQSVPFEKDNRNLNLWSNLQYELQRQPKRASGADRLLRDLRDLKKLPLQHSLPREPATAAAAPLAPAPREEIEERLRRMLEAATIENVEPDMAADRRDGMDECGAAAETAMKPFRHARPLSASARVSAAAKARVPIIRPRTASAKRASDGRGTPGYVRGGAPVAGLPLQQGRPHTATERTRELARPAALMAVGGAETALARTWARVGEWDTTIVPSSRPAGHAQHMRHSRPESAPSRIAARRRS